MRLKLNQDIKIREETFGAIIRIPKNLERVDLPQFYQVNKIGLQILRFCDGNRGIDEIIATISEQYPDNEIDKDVLYFVNQLIKLGIIEKLSPKKNRR